MKCPKCKSTLRPSKKYPGYYLCDHCRKRYSETAIIKDSSSTIKETVPKKKKKKRSKKIFLTLLILFILSLICLGLYYIEILSKKESVLPQQEQVTSFSVNELASYKDSELKILNTELSSGNNLIKPMSNHQFLFINVEVKNNSKSALSINSISNFKLFANNAEVLTSSSSYAALPEAYTRLNCTLSSAETISGWICFEIPLELQEVQFLYSNPVWSLQKIQFDITLSQDN